MKSTIWQPLDWKTKANDRTKFTQTNILLLDFSNYIIENS